jgi:hypothetical protein
MGKPKAQLPKERVPKRLRSSIAEAEPAGKRGAEHLAKSLRHVVLTSESGPIDCFVAGSGSQLAVLYDAAADVATVLACLSKAGEIVSQKEFSLPASLAGEAIPRGSRFAAASADEWNALRVELDSRDALASVAALDAGCPTVDDEGNVHGMTSECC